MALEAVLIELGENIIRASSGREALKYLLDHEVALIFARHQDARYDWL